MPQQINLYNPAFEPRHELLSFKGAVIGWAVVVVLAAGVAALGLARLRTAESQEREVVQQLAAAQAEAQRLGGEMSSRHHDPRLAEEISRLEADVRGREEVMTALHSGGLGDTRGYSDHLKAFARQSFEGIWLTGLSIATAGRDVSVEGRAAQAAYVPSYLKRLNGESAMQGHPFSELIIQEPPVDPAARNQPRADYVEFKLTTKADGGTASGTGKTQ
ncbi:MAG TPA: hypothetical protein VHB46_13855 [Burkholderiales bacterium]|nr:hypothetical protein [Burkholderiales bacterium]